MRFTAQIVALAVLSCALLAYLAAALASDGRSDTSAPPVVTRPPVDAGGSAPIRADAPAVPSSVAPAPPEPISIPSASHTGEAVVRTFYGALGRGNGDQASALVIAEKRGSRAFSPQAISRFYGGLAEPLRLTAITPLARDEYRVGYVYSAGSRRCDGEAVVSLTSRDGRELIRSIRALKGC